jgi:serine protease AprX
VLKPDVAAPGSHIVGPESAGSYLATTYSERHVAGSGADAYMELSGTSMASGVVSGAAALLLEERDGMSPADTKAALQVTASFMARAGLVGAGAGSIDVVAAAELCEGGAQLGPVVIGAETVTPSSITYIAPIEVRSYGER